MQTIAAVLVALLLIQAAPSKPAPAASTGRIAGRVTVDSANTPIAGARIMLLPATPPTGPFGMPPQTTSDQEGRFVLENLTPGAYRLNVQKTGFAPMDEAGGGASTQVTAGQTTAIDVHLQRGGAIVGKVLDASGEPMADAPVMAMRRIKLNGPGPGPRLIPAGGGQQTNDLGEFRIAGLAPGEYYVAATARGSSPFGGPAVTPTSNGTASMTTFFPGTIDETAAHPVTVAAGETVNNIVFTMQSVPAFRVSGRAVDESGAPVSGAMLMLIADMRGGAFMGPRGGARSGDDGRFTIDEVPSGTYRLTASVPVAIGGYGPAGRGSGGGGIVVSGGAVAGGVSGGGVVTGGVSGGTYTTWSSGAGSGTMVGGGVTSRMVGGGNTPTEVIVNGADVTDVRVLALRPPRQ